MFITKAKHNTLIEKLELTYKFEISGMKLLHAGEIDSLKEESTRLRYDNIRKDNEIAQLKGQLVAFAHEHHLPAPSTCVDR